MTSTAIQPGTRSSSAFDPGNIISPSDGSFTFYEGRPHPVGPTVVRDRGAVGVNFSVYSENATSIELLLFRRPSDLEPCRTYTLNSVDHKSFHFWHVYVEGVTPGMGYAYRVDGPDNHRDGHRFDRSKVLIDPYSKGNNTTLWKRGDACQYGLDNLHTSMRSVVIDIDDYDWEGDRPLNRPMSETIIYEMHVGGFTKSPTSGVANPGTFSGVIEKIPYLKELGVTAVELLPVFSFDNKDVIKEHDGEKLVNYWGYSTVGYFAPHDGYCSSPESGSHIKEFRDMVKALHAAGIEVILDVVFNHTDEGNHQGPVFSFKGFENSTYYYLTGPDGSREFYYDYTGCGNTFNCNHPICEKFILDCLRFWVNDMHVDGFRFDEGSVLSRGEDGSPLSHPPVIWSIELDEVLADSKAIAEAWDAAGLYQIGYFPGARWAEWNGKYRDAIRRFLKGDPGLVGEVASRITGSADLYQWRHHEPVNSVNFINAHDGFTLYDLVAYNNKNNWANGEDSRDGIDENLSWNCGAEGQTDDVWVNKLRTQQIKNAAVLLTLSQGVPMFVAGDEHRRTQYGNNNTYCHDSPLNWFDWNYIEQNKDMVRFWSMLLKKRSLYREHFKGRYFTGRVNQYGIPEIAWHGTAINQPGWTDPEARCLALTLGDVSDALDGSYNLHIMINMHWDSVPFEVPHYAGLAWRRIMDTSLPTPEDIQCQEDAPIFAEPTYLLSGRSIVVLSTRSHDPATARI